MGKKRRGAKATTSSEGRPPEHSSSSTPSSSTVDPDVFASVLSVDFPLLDITLILTIISDYVADGTLHENEQLVRAQLGALEAQVVADAADAAEAGNDGGANSEPVPSHCANLRSRDSPSFAPSPTAFSATGSTGFTSVCDDELEELEPQSEADLLALFFPNLKPKDIAGALSTEPSLEAAVDHLLSVELICGVERSGRWGDETPSEDEGVWHVASSRTSRRGSNSTTQTLTPSIPGAATPVLNGPKKKKKDRKNKTTTPLVDMLQRGAAPSLSPITRPVTDVWSAFSSLAAYLAEIAPRAQAPWYLSYLHAPDYFSAYDAVRAALTQLSLTSEMETPADVIGILESLYGIDFYADDDDAAQLRSCVGAADGDASDVMDLMDVLSDLREWPDYEAARMRERDPFDLLAEFEGALPAFSPSLSASSSRPATPAPAPVLGPAGSASRVANNNRLTRPAPPPPKSKAVRAVPGAKASTTPFASAHELHLPASSNWGGQATQVQHNANWRASGPSTGSARSSGAGKKRSNAKPATVAGPAGVGLGRVSANASRSSTSGTNTIAADHFSRADAAWSRRRDAMLAATAQFQAGGAKHLQRQVAGYYRLRARELANDAREHQLNGARVLVSRQLESNAAQIDLHHRTVAEATTLASEAVEGWWARRIRAAGAGEKVDGRFVVITGKGLHSAGQRGVLGPAVAAALRKVGWRVEEHPGYLTVKGR